MSTDKSVSTVSIALNCYTDCQYKRTVMILSLFIHYKIHNNIIKQLSTMSTEQIFKKQDTNILYDTDTDIGQHPTISLVFIGLCSIQHFWVYVNILFF